MDCHKSLHETLQVIILRQNHTFSFFQLGCTGSQIQQQKRQQAIIWALAAELIPDPDHSLNQMIYFDWHDHVYKNRRSIV